MPIDWETVPLKELIDPARGISYGIVQPGSPVADGVPIVRVSDIRNGRIATTNPLRVSPKIESSYTRTRLRGGELLLTLVGTVGEAAVVPEGLRDWNTARAVAVIPVKAEIGSYWVKLALEVPSVRERIHSRLNTTVQATLNLGDVAELPIVIPPSQERRALSQVIGSLDDKIELNRRMNETLEAMARALFKSWFIDFDPVRDKADDRKPVRMDDATANLFPDSFKKSELGPIPRNWNALPVLELADLLSGGTPSTATSEYWDGPIPWASAKDVSQCGEAFLISTERSITETGLSNSATKIIPRFSTVVVARGATTGRFTMFGDNIAMNQTCYALRDKKGCDFYINGVFAELVAQLVHAAHGSVFDTITTETF